MNKTDYDLLLLAWKHNAFYDDKKPTKCMEKVLTSLKFDKETGSYHAYWIPIKDFLVIYRKYLLGNL